MRIFESVRTAGLEIYSHKTRSALSFFSIAIGTASILFTLTQVTAMNQRMTKALELMGPGRMTIEMKRNYVSKGLSPGLTHDDAKSIARQMPELYMVSPVARQWGGHFYYDKLVEKGIVVWGITPQWTKREWVYKLSGRFINQYDMDHCSRVCVLQEPGGWAGKKPFWARWFRTSPFQEYIQRHDLLGKQARIGSHLYTVIGIIREPPKDKDPRWFGSGYGGNGTIYVPITTYLKYTFNPAGRRYTENDSQNTIDEITIDTGKEKSVPMAMQKIKQILKFRHRGEEDYEITDYRETLQKILNEQRAFMIAVLAIGIVAILAGGIGIMNVTLATIYSRIKEIGIRRAIGAAKSDILLQFVMEAMSLGLCGGVAGLGIGCIGIYFMNQNASIRGQMSISWWSLIVSLAAAVFTGFIFAIYPAWQASKLDPVEALRYE